jgi:hypothetical protein
LQLIASSDCDSYLERYRPDSFPPPDRALYATCWRPSNYRFRGPKSNKSIMRHDVNDVDQAEFVEDRRRKPNTPALA